METGLEEEIAYTKELLKALEEGIAACRGIADMGREAASKEWEYVFEVCIQQSEMPEMPIKGKLPCREREIKGTELQHYPGKRKEPGKTKI